MQATGVDKCAAINRSDMPIQNPEVAPTDKRWAIRH